MTALADILAGRTSVRMPSDSGGADHLVRYLPGVGWRCSDCPDHEYRRHDCKHIRRLRARLAEMQAGAV